MSYNCFIVTRLNNQLFQIIQKEKTATEIAVKIARVFGPLSSSEASPSIWSCYANLLLPLFISLEIDSLYGL